MRYAIAFVCALWSFLGPCPEVRAAPAFGAAPKGDATVVASRIIKYNFPGPDLPSSVIARFKEAAKLSGYLSGSDAYDLIPEAKAAVRSAQLNPHEAADQFTSSLWNAAPYLRAPR